MDHHQLQHYTGHFPPRIQVLQNNDIFISSNTIKKFSTDLKEAIQDANLFQIQSHSHKKQIKKKPSNHQSQSNNLKIQHQKSKVEPELYQGGRAKSSVEIENEMIKNVEGIKCSPNLIESQFYEDFDQSKPRDIHNNEKAYNSSHRSGTSSSPPVIKGTSEVVAISRQKIIKHPHHHEQIEQSNQKKPQFYNDPKITQSIQMGSTVFERGYRQESSKQGFSKLLSKILESNLTVRQVKNGQTLFDKEMMQKNYNNPFLEVDKMKEDLQEYIERTKPNNDIYMNSKARLAAQSYGANSKPQRTGSPTKSVNFNFAQTTKNSMNETGLSSPKKHQTYGLSQSPVMVPPFTILRREKADDIKKQLLFPPSPAFVNNIKTAQRGELESLVDFCKAKNIPFQENEDRFYKVNQTNQSHKLYATYLNKCFETFRPTEFEVGVKMMKDSNNTVESAYQQVRDKRKQSLEQNSQEVFMPRLVRQLDGTHGVHNKSLNVDVSYSRKRNYKQKLNKSDIIPHYNTNKPFLKTQPVFQANIKEKLLHNDTSNSLNLYGKIEAKKKLILQELPEKLENPYKEELKQKKKLSKRQREDPVRKIILTNKHIQKQKRIYNEKLLKILERVDLDRPILMHDKLDIIWGNNVTNNSSMGGGNHNLNASNAFGSTQNQSFVSNSQQESSSNYKIVNQFNVKAQLEKKKLMRSLTNQKQMHHYNSLLDYINTRVDRFVIDKDRSPIRIKPDEKERQFLDAFRLIIQSGYVIEETDFYQILDFINVQELNESGSSTSNNNNNIKRIKSFFKFAAKGLGFNEDIIDEVLLEVEERDHIRLKLFD